MAYAFGRHCVRGMASAACWPLFVIRLLTSAATDGPCHLSPGGSRPPDAMAGALFLGVARDATAGSRRRKEAGRMRDYCLRLRSTAFVAWQALRVGFSSSSASSRRRLQAATDGSHFPYRRGRVHPAHARTSADLGTFGLCALAVRGYTAAHVQGRGEAAARTTQTASGPSRRARRIIP